MCLFYCVTLFPSLQNVSEAQYHVTEEEVQESWTPDSPGGAGLQPQDGQEEQEQQQQQPGQQQQHQHDAGHSSKTAAAAAATTGCCQSQHSQGRNGNI